VHEVGAETAQEARQRPGHPQLLVPRRELDRLDSVRHELGAPEASTIRPALPAMAELESEETSEGERRNEG